MGGMMGQFSVHRNRQQYLTEKPFRLVRDQDANVVEAWDLTDREMQDLIDTLIEFDDNRCADS